MSSGFIAVKRHHDCSDFYKRKYLIGVDLQFQKFSPSSSWQETWLCASKHGAGDGTENPTSRSAGTTETVCHTGNSLSIGDLKANPHSGTLPPTRPHLPIVPSIQTQESMGALPIKTTTVWNILSFEFVCLCCLVFFSQTTWMCLKKYGCMW